MIYEEINYDCARYYSFKSFRQGSFFCYGLKEFTFQTDGTVTSIVFNLHGEHEFSVDDGEFYSFSEVLEFQVLDK